MGPCSWIRPSFRTTMRFARSAATPRSWVTRSTAVPYSRRKVVDEVEDALLHRDVEGAGRLVRDDQRRPQRHRDGDQHALAHASRQLVRILLRAKFRLARGRPAPGGRSPARRSPWECFPVASRGSEKSPPTCAPMVFTGLSELPGSCGIRLILRPRTVSSCFCDQCAMSVPFSRIAPRFHAAVLRRGAR